MKRFNWSLQRLLDVTIQRELALRAELLSLTRAIATARQEIAQRNALLRSQLRDLARQSLTERLPRQELFMQMSVGEETKIAHLRHRVTRLEVRRTDKAEELMRTRSSRETLEKKRQDAKAEHRKSQLRQEQKQLDEAAHLAFARKGLEGRRQLAAPGS